MQRRIDFEGPIFVWYKPKTGLLSFAMINVGGGSLDAEETLSVHKIEPEEVELGLDILALKYPLSREAI